MSALKVAVGRVGWLGGYVAIALILGFWSIASSVYVAMGDFNLGLDIFRLIFVRGTYGPVAELEPWIEHSRTYWAKNPLWLRVHVAGNSTALLVGLVQLWKGSRGQRLETVHKRLGWVYVWGLAIGCVGGIGLSFGAYGGLVAQQGLLWMGVVNIALMAMAVLAVKSGDVEAHQEWMNRSYFTIASSSLGYRLAWLWAGPLAGKGVFALLAWGSWAGGLALADLRLGLQRWINRPDATAAKKIR